MTEVTSEKERKKEEVKGRAQYKALEKVQHRWKRNGGRNKLIENCEARKQTALATAPPSSLLVSF